MIYYIGEKWREHCARLAREIKGRSPIHAAVKSQLRLAARRKRSIDSILIGSAEELLRRQTSTRS